MVDGAPIDWPRHVPKMSQCFPAILSFRSNFSRSGSPLSSTAALFVAAYPAFWIHQTFGAVDLPVASFLIFGTIWWIQALRLESWRWTLLAGVACGFVIGSRYQGVVL